MTQSSSKISPDRFGTALIRDRQVMAPFTPLTGKSISSLAIKPDCEHIRHYPWMQKSRSNFLFAIEHNLEPDHLADEDKCRLLFTRGEINKRVKSCPYRELGHVSDPFIAMHESSPYNSIPTMDFFEEPYIRVKRDTCKRKKKKKVVAKAPKKIVPVKQPKSKSGAGIAGGKAARRLFSIKSNLAGIPKPAKKEDAPPADAGDAPAAPAVNAPSSSGKEASKPKPAPLAVKSSSDKQQMDSNLSEPLPMEPYGSVILHILNSEEAMWRPWNTRPIATLLSICDSVMDVAMDLGHDIAVQRRVFVEQLYPDASLWYNDKRHQRFIASLPSRKNVWSRNIIFALANFLVSIDFGSSLEKNITDILKVHRHLDAVFARIEDSLGTAFEVGAENGSGAWLSAYVPSFSSRRCVPAINSLLFGMIFPSVKVNVFNIVPFQSFVPTGVPPHWDQGGVLNLMFRAVMWKATDFSLRIPSTDRAGAFTLLRDHPALVALCISKAIRSVLDTEGGMGANIDINAFIEENVYHRREEYKTILENLLQQDIPYWSTIEPILSSFCLGWAIFNGLSSSSIKVRIATALGAIIHSYVQHTLASRCFCEMLKNVKSLLYKGLEKLVAVFEAIWRSSPGEDRQQMSAEDPLEWFSRMCACMDAEFTRKLLQAFSFIGAVVTCPWKNFGETQMTEWAMKAFSFISDSASASMKKFSFLEQMFELVKFFFLRANLAWQHKDFSLFLYGRDEFNDLINKVNIFVGATAMLPYMSTTWSTAVVYGVPYNLESYQSLMTEIGVLAKQITKDLVSRKIKSLPTVVSAAMSRYATAVATYEAFGKNQKNRPLPYVLFMVGPPSAGKNTLLEEVVEKVFKVCSFPKAIYELRDGIPVMTGYEMKKVDPCVWTSNAFDEYASGFTNMHNVVSFIEPTLASASTADGVKHSFSQLGSFFSFVDTAPYSPVMASVDDKGKMTSNGILFATVSANDDSCNKWMLSCQMALLRRIGRMLVCLPYPSFKDSVTQGLDRSKIRETEFKTDDDMWYFVVKKPTSCGTWNERETTSTADWVIDLDAGDAGFIYTQHDLMDWLVKRIKVHFQEQMTVMQKSDKVKHAQCCELDYRSGHEKSDHCGICTSLMCGPGNKEPSLCLNRIMEISEGNLACNLCSEQDKPGCICCDEIKQVSVSIRKGKRIGKMLSEQASIKNEPGYIAVSHCRKCYRSAKTRIFGEYTCYACGQDNHHSLRRAFAYGVSKSELNIVDLDDDKIAELLIDAGGNLWVGNDESPGPHKQGHQQQVRSEVICAVAGGFALGAAITYGLSRRRFKIVVDHRIDSPALDAIGNLSQGISNVFRLPNAPGIPYPEALPEVSEATWYTWAIDSVSAFSKFLKSFTVDQWIKFAGLVALISGIYAFSKRPINQILVDAQGPVKVFDERNLCEVLKRAHDIDGEQQMGLFDSDFILRMLKEHGLTTGARPSKRSEVQIDNPWLNQSSLVTRVNFGKRMGHLGVDNCAQAVTRIERSLYVFGCVPVAPTESGFNESVKGARINALLLSGNVFVVNTHFWMHAFVSQVDYNLRDKPRQELDSILNALLDISDWDEFRKQVQAYGVNSVHLLFDRIYDSSAFGDRSGRGLSPNAWETVHFNQIAGCISTDISVVKLTRVARNEKGGIVYNLNDLTKGLLIPREHTAPTDAMLFPRNEGDDSLAFVDNIGTAVFTPKITFHCNIRGHERAYDTEAWTIRLTKPTVDGDCGLPLLGVHHTKYTNESGVKRADTSGDTVAILGIHRIYSVARQTAHCAPLSIDMISYLLDKLDKNEQQLDGRALLYKVRTYSPGVVPQAGYKVDFGRDVRGVELSTKMNRIPITFKSGSENVYHDKSPLQWMGKGLNLSYAPDLGEAVSLHGEAVGSVGGFRQGQFKSSVTRLPTANYFEFEQKHSAPDLNNRYGKEMNLVAMSGAHNGDLDYDLLRHIGSHMVKDTIRDLDLAFAGWRENVHPLTDIETVAGSSEANFTPGINRSTGMGFPFYGPKNQFVHILRDKHSNIESVSIQDEVLNEIKAMVDAYSVLSRANPVFTATPKDERLGESKIIPIYDVKGCVKCHAHNLRVFLCGSYPFIHLQRQQYLSVIRLICDFPEVFEMAVGTNVASPRWGTMKDWLTWNGDADNFILAGDYSKFDKRMTCTWITVAFEVLLSIMRESGNYSEGDMRIAEGIAIDTANPLIDWFGDWFFATNGHPSGHALTTIINGIVNRLYLRYAYYKLWSSYHGKCPLLCNGYRANVRTYVYGDDNISGVVGVARKFFTMPNICGVLKGVGVILTTEDKSAVIHDYTNIRDASFLKRTWVCHSNGSMKVWCAPLARKSLEAMVTVGVLNTKDVSAQTYSILRSFCDEFFHYGREEFDSVRNKILAICTDTEYWVREGFPIVGVALLQQIEERGQSVFPTYDELLLRWEKATWVPMCSV